MAEALKNPNLEALRAAMKKLDFLVGMWTGNALITRGPGEKTELLQTEEAGYKLDGLILVIEGIGRTKSDGVPILQALGIISYADESKIYHMRAFNDGRFLETEIRLLEQGKGMTWSFMFGEIKTKSVLRINENGDWTELHEIIVGSQPSRKLMEVAVRRHN
jgi:hypothetical protein